VKKELRPVHDALNCDVCGRTILKGERTETYLAPGGHRNRVCQLCFTRATHHGWIRESADGSIPARFPREEKGSSLISRLRRRRSEPAAAPPPQSWAEPEPPGAGADAEFPADDPFAAPAPARSRPKDPRHVRAVPTTAGAKVERALELFNDSDHQRTIAGLRRTLGDPWVSARPDDGGPSAVSLVVAWELSWYRYRVDLGDESDPVLMLEKGEEIDQIDEYLREWNAALDPNGRVLAANSVSDGGSEG
jgi:hypothetical protein